MSLWVLAATVAHCEPDHRCQYFGRPTVPGSTRAHRSSLPVHRQKTFPQRAVGAGGHFLSLLPIRSMRDLSFA